MKNRRGEYLYFCSAEQDSLYALTLFRKKEKQGTLNVQETGLLLCMEQRAEDSWIYLMPRRSMRLPTRKVREAG